MSYVYIEYPKCLYQRSGETVTVATAEEEAVLIGDGYLTAEQLHRAVTESGVETEKKKKTK